jgi:hypothetical protein
MWYHSKKRVLLLVWIYSFETERLSKFWSMSCICCSDKTYNNNNFDIPAAYSSQEKKFEISGAQSKF